MSKELVRRVQEARAEYAREYTELKTKEDIKNYFSNLEKEIDEEE